ncbi:hypothetical protein [Streptomyces sp. NBC_01304]|uniref:hypothetical protein n=1 Tax=Streptomyces sp. NBC_01304 TaxID=2903818 RepID=UPI002E13F9D8|nr:hypothetical protein OG430_00440 [Streptomyces sp. NBC_01304]
MRFAKTSVALTAAALLSVAAPSATADDDPQYPKGNPPATNCLPSFYNPPTGQKDKPMGHYYDDANDKKTAFWFFAESGTGTLPFAPATLAELKRNGIKAEGVCPVGPLKGGKGVWTPVGRDGYSNINFLNGRIWYPGGWKFTNTKTGRSHRVDGFWLHNFPFITRASANVYIDDKPSPHIIELAHYDTVDFYTDLINPRINQGKISLGPKDWKFKLSEQYSRELRDILGADIKPDTHVITLEINASLLPGQQLPLKPGYEKDEPGN